MLIAGKWIVALSALCCCLPLAARAQAPTGTSAQAAAFPSKPVRILVGFTPGGGPDIVARALAQKLGETWKQPVTVENRPGAGGNIAAQAVATAAADGSTLLSVTPGHAVAPAIYPKLPFDTAKDFAGITLTATGPALVIVGCMMMSGVRKIDFDEPTEAIPAFMTLALVVFTYNVANGLTAGLILHPLLKLLTGRFRELNLGIVVLAAICVAYYVVGLPH